MGVSGAAQAPPFVYGPLRDDDLLRIVVGRDVACRPAFLKNRRIGETSEGGLPLLVPAEGQVADGLLLTNLSDAERARLDFYQASYDCTPVAVHVVAEGEKVAALACCLTEGTEASDANWSIEAWQEAKGPLIRAAAGEIMRMCGQFTPQEVQDRMTVISTRAQAMVNAQSHPTPRVLRSNFSADDVNLVSQSIAYSNFFLFEDLKIRHRKHQGGNSEVLDRGITVTADAVTVLPYDPIRDNVLLIEQFRVAFYRRGDPHPWAIEGIAGRIDPGETPEETAHREAREEAGVGLNRLHLVGRYYSSPGSNTEYLHSYIAECDLPGDAAGIGGLETEHEDIRALVVSFAELEDALAQGEIENSPLLVSTLWLQRERPRIRAEAAAKSG